MPSDNRATKVHECKVLGNPDPGRPRCDAEVESPLRSCPSTPRLSRIADAHRTRSRSCKRSIKGEIRPTPKKDTNISNYKSR